MVGSRQQNQNEGKWRYNTISWRNVNFIFGNNKKSLGTFLQAFDTKLVLLYNCCEKKQTCLLQSSKVGDLHFDDFVISKFR